MWRAGLWADHFHQPVQYLFFHDLVPPRGAGTLIWVDSLDARDIQDSGIPGQTPPIPPALDLSSCSIGSCLSLFWPGLWSTTHEDNREAAGILYPLYSHCWPPGVTSPLHKLLAPHPMSGSLLKWPSLSPPRAFQTIAVECWPFWSGSSFASHGLAASCSPGAGDKHLLPNVTASLTLPVLLAGGDVWKARACSAGKEITFSDGSDFRLKSARIDRVERYVVLPLCYTILNCKLDMTPK